MRKLLIAALAGATIATGAVIAQTAAPAPQARADANRNGTVTRAEFIVQAGARFDARDADRNGTVAADERRGPMRGAPATTRAEAMARAGAMFDRLDTNKDGALSDTERWSAMGRMGSRRGGAGMMPPPPGGPMAPGMQPGMHRGAKMLERVDTDKDGKIGRDEMRAEADARFARLDTDKDGYLDRTELQSARQGMRHRGWARRGPGGDMPPPPPAPPAK